MALRSSFNVCEARHRLLGRGKRLCLGHRARGSDGYYANAWFSSSRGYSGSLPPLLRARWRLSEWQWFRHVLAVATAPGDLLFVRLRGVKRRSGSIYDGRRWFQVEQVLEIRPRASGECPKVAHSASTVLPS
jgi:hypothetical protein